MPHSGTRDFIFKYRGVGAKLWHHILRRGLELDRRRIHVWRLTARRFEQDNGNGTKTETGFETDGSGWSREWACIQDVKW